MFQKVFFTSITAPFYTGYPYRRTGTATVTVDLIDINDNGPKLVTPTVYIAENMPIGSATSPREIKALDEDDNDVGHGPPFTMSATNGSQNSGDFQFTFHQGIPSNFSSILD